MTVGRPRDGKEMQEKERKEIQINLTANVSNHQQKKKT
jgi:hypothetical protein